MGRRNIKCYVSSSAFLFHDLKKILDIGIQQKMNIELSSSLSYYPDFMACLNRAQDKIQFLVHNYFPPPPKPFVINLASIDPYIHAESVKLCKTAMNLCEYLKAPFYSVHAGFAFNPAPHQLGDPEAQQKLFSRHLVQKEKVDEQFFNTIRELANYAESHGVGLLIENNVLTQENLLKDNRSPLLLTNIKEISNFFLKLDDPRVGLLLDTGHAKVSAQTLGIPVELYITDLKPFIRALHLSDNNGFRDTNQIFDEKVWFAPFLKDLINIPMVIEVNSLPLGEILKQMQIVNNLCLNKVI